MLYSNKIGRLALELRNWREGEHATLSIPDGWNDSVEVVRNTLTREELHDLRHLIDRALAAMAAERR